MGTFELHQPVVVFRGSGNDRRHEGVITKVGRTLVTIEWDACGRTESVQFRMSDQRENLPAHRSYSSSGSFRTMEQDALAERRHAAENGFARLGLRKGARDSLTLDEMEAVIKLLDGMRENS